MGFEMKITGSDGKRYNSVADMVQAETGRMVDDHVQAVERAIRSTRCQKHGKHASATRRRTRDGFTFDISGCCDALVSEAQTAAANVR